MRGQQIHKRLTSSTIYFTVWRKKVPKQFKAYKTCEVNSGNPNQNFSADHNQHFPTFSLYTPIQNIKTFRTPLNHVTSSLLKIHFSRMSRSTTKTMTMSCLKSTKLIGSVRPTQKRILMTIVWTRLKSEIFTMNKMMDIKWMPKISLCRIQHFEAIEFSVEINGSLILAITNPSGLIKNSMKL